LGFDAEPLKTEPMDIDPGTAVQTVSVDMPPVPPDPITPKVEPGVTSPVAQVQARQPSVGSLPGNTESLKSLLTQPPKESITVALSESLTKKVVKSLSVYCLVRACCSLSQSLWFY
jgi:hypothetical protein